MDNERLKANSAILSVISNTILVIAKLIVGIVVGSVSIISEAIHSGVDLLAALIAWFSVRTSGKPRDEHHQWGHGKIENISGTIEALLIFAAAIWILVEATKKILHPEPLDNVIWGVAVMAVSCIANFMVSQRLFKVGKETDSVALLADAWHLRTDVWTSFGVLAGMLVIYLGKLLLPNVDLSIIDPIFAILVAVMIIHAAWELTVSAGKDLLDIKLPDAELAQINAVVDSYGFPVLGTNDLRTRKSGSTRYIELHIEVKYDMPVFESHNVGEQISTRIQAMLPNSEVTVHIDPCKFQNCKSDCVDNCSLK